MIYLTVARIIKRQEPQKTVPRFYLGTREYERVGFSLSQRLKNGIMFSVGFNPLELLARGLNPGRVMRQIEKENAAKYHCQISTLYWLSLLYATWKH